MPRRYGRAGSPRSTVGTPRPCRGWRRSFAARTAARACGSSEPTSRRPESSGPPHARRRARRQARARRPHRPRCRGRDVVHGVQAGLRLDRAAGDRGGGLAAERGIVASARACLHRVNSMLLGAKQDADTSQACRRTRGLAAARRVREAPLPRERAELARNPSTLCGQSAGSARRSGSDEWGVHANRFAKAVSETGATGLEPAASGVTGRRSNQLSYAPGRPVGAVARP